MQLAQQVDLPETVGPSAEAVCKRTSKRKPSASPQADEESEAGSSSSASEEEEEVPDLSEWEEPSDVSDIDYEEE